MNYEKIYRDFIVSRREREASIVGYSEKHHIQPKALGGGKDVTRASRTGGLAGGFHWERLGIHAADGRIMKNV
jgi:hypothetical protein